MKAKASAEEPLTAEGQQYHTRLKEGDVSRYVLLPGDPFRTQKFEGVFDQNSFKEVAHYREYHTVRGNYKGADVTVTSTGIGDLATSICLEELVRVGADTFIRLGTTGALQDYIPCGSMIINTGMVRADGTTKAYIQPEYPALANYEVVMALIEACERVGVNYFVGIGATADSFYAGQARPGYKGYWQSWWDNMVSDYQRAGILNWEGEASTVFVLSSLYGMRGGFVCNVVDNRITHEWNPIGEMELCRVGAEAVNILTEWDEIKKEKGVKYLSPRLFK